MSANRGEKYFRSAPTSARKTALNGFLSLYGVLSVIAVLALHGSAPPYFDLAGALVLFPLVVWVSVRARSVSVTANEHEVRIANQFRTYRLAWSEIEGAQLSSIPVYLGATTPAILFRRKTGWPIKAQAMTPLRSEQESTMKDLRRVAPAEVDIDTEVDKYRPQPLFRRRK